MSTEPLVAEPATVEPRARHVRPRRGIGWIADAFAIVVLLALFPVVHDVGSMLRAPYFLDEAWVALSVRFPLGDLPVVTASTPIGWSLLLRLVPGADNLRLVPLAFHLICLVAAYALGRQLASRTPGLARLAGVACAAMVLLLPAQQVRHDLKQYSADAAVTLVLLALAAWTEAGWSRRRLGIVVAVVAVSSVLSSVTVIAAACVFGGLVLVALVRRQWRRAVESVAAGLLALAFYAGAYLTATARGRTQALQDFWAGYFPTVGQLPSYLWQQSNSLFPLLGARGSAAALALGTLFVLGVITVARSGRPSVAIALVLLPVAAVVLGVARVYPLLDLRTSHFLMVTIGATAGLGIAGVARWLPTAGRDLFVRRRRDRRNIDGDPSISDADGSAVLGSAVGGSAVGGSAVTGSAVNGSAVNGPDHRRAVRRVSPTVAAALVILVALGGYAAVNQRWYRFGGAAPGVDYRTPMTMEDTRSAAAYVAAHRAPEDVIVVSVMARYGFGFYWQADPIGLVTPYGNAIGWAVDFPNQPSIVAIQTGLADSIRDQLNQALDLAAQRGPDTRVWLVRSHLVPEEADAWRQALLAFTVQQVTDGPEPVALLTK